MWLPFLFLIEKGRTIYYLVFCLVKDRFQRTKELQHNLLQLQLASVTCDKLASLLDSAYLKNELIKKVQSQVITMISFAFIKRSNFVKSWLLPSLLWVVFHFFHFVDSGLSCVSLCLIYFLVYFLYLDVLTLNCMINNLHIILPPGHEIETL